MSDIALLSVFTDYDNYKTYSHQVKESSLSPDIRMIYEAMKTWYTKHEAAFTKDELTAYVFHVLNPNMKDDKKKQITTFIDNIYSQDDMLVADIISSYATLQCAYDIEEIVNSIVDGTGSTLEEVQDRLDKHLEGTVEESTVLTIDSLPDLLKDADANRYKWSLDILNTVSGGAGAGDLVVIFGRPDTGKTALAITESLTFMKQFQEGKHLVFINNEEIEAKVLSRYITCAYDTTDDVVAKNWEAAIEKWKGDYGDRFIMHPASLNNKGAIMKTLDTYKPGCIVFNTLDKVNGVSKSDSEVKRLQVTYQWARDLANKYNCPVIGICQSNADGEGSKYMYQTNMAGSKTDKAGEADFIIGIGSQNTLECTEGINGKVTRFINVPKNKLTSGLDKYRREVYGVPVTFNRLTGRYSDQQQELSYY
jgi:replicative DNA helicase